MGEFTVRPMLMADIAQIHAIESQIFPFPWSAGNFKDALKSGYDAWVFQSGSQCLGYAVVMWVLDEVHLLNLSVEKTNQSKGYGKAFLSWLMINCRAKGAKTLLLEVRPSNSPAITLYDACGLIEIGRRKNYYPSWQNNREDAIVMQCHLLNETCPTHSKADHVH